MAKGLGGLALVGAWVVATVDLRPQVPIEPPRVKVAVRAPAPAPAPSSRPAPGGNLRVGFARRVLEPPNGVPLGGYAARLGAGATAVCDSAGVSAMVLVDGEHVAALVNLEVVLVPHQLRVAVADSLATRGLGVEPLWLVATHTHSGPGAFWPNWLGQGLGLGRFDDVWFAQLAGSITETLMAARAAAQPVRPFRAAGVGTDLTQPRSNHSARVPTEVHVLGFEVQGEVVGGLMVHSAHATILRDESRCISGDWPGAVARALAEAPGGVWLTLPGAQGDLRAAIPAGTAKDRRVATYASLVTDRVREIWASRAPALEEWAGVSVSGGWPRPDASTLLPPGLRRAGGNLLSLFSDQPLEVAILDVGGLRLIGIGAEPVREAGARLEAAAGHSGPVEVISLVNAYLSYVELADRLAAGTGEAKRCFYGGELLEDLEELVAVASEAMGTPAPLRSGFDD